MSLTIVTDEPVRNYWTNPVIEMGFLYNRNGMADTWQKWNDYNTVYADVTGTRNGDYVDLDFTLSLSSPGLNTLPRPTLVDATYFIDGLVKRLGGETVKPLVIPRPRERYERVLNNLKNVSGTYRIPYDNVDDLEKLLA